jgi:tetratricopeptide (TPR) repeat protein
MAYFQKGVTEEKARRFMVAFNQFQKAIQFKADNIDAQRELGVVAVEMRRYDNAIPAFEKVIALQKDDAVATENLANLYFWIRQWPQAIAYAQKAQQLKVGKNMNYMIGKSYYEQEDYGQGFKYLQAASREDTTNAEIPYLTARAFVDMNNYKAAIPFFQRAITLDSTKVQWIYECALTFATIPDDKSAIKYYELAALRGFKKDNDFYENLSDSYLAAGETEKGLELLLKVYQKKPADLDLLYTIAHTYYRLKKYQDAIDFWDKILGFDKENAKAVYMIGMAYQKKGEGDKGKQLCDKAIQMDPSLSSLKQERKMDM